LKKNIIYLLLLTLFGGILVIISLPNQELTTTVFKSYALGYLSILSGPFAVWFFSYWIDTAIVIVTTILGVSIISLWFYMIRKEYQFWKFLILYFIWVLLGSFVLFAEITSHV